MKMKSAVCDDNDHDSCSGKFYKYDETSRKKIMESCSCSCHYKKKTILDGVFVGIIIIFAICFSILEW
jgi:hypothetical protein